MSLSKCSPWLEWGKHCRQIRQRAPGKFPFAHTPGLEDVLTALFYAFSLCTASPGSGRWWPWTCVASGWPGAQSMSVSAQAQLGWISNHGHFILCSSKCTDGAMPGSQDWRLFILFLISCSSVEYGLRGRTRSNDFGVHLILQSTEESMLCPKFIKSTLSLKFI